MKVDNKKSISNVENCLKFENNLLQILNLNDGKKFIFSIIQKSFFVTPFRSRTKNLDLQILKILNSKFEVLLKKVKALLAAAFACARLSSTSFGP